MKTNELPPVLEGKLADFRRLVWIVKLKKGVRELFVLPHPAELNIGHHRVLRAITIGLRSAGASASD